MDDYHANLPADYRFAAKSVSVPAEQLIAMTDQIIDEIDPVAAAGLRENLASGDRYTMKLYHGTLPQQKLVPAG